MATLHQISTDYSPYDYEYSDDDEHIAMFLSDGAGKS